MDKRQVADIAFGNYPMNIEGRLLKNVRLHSSEESPNRNYEAQRGVAEREIGTRLISSWTSRFDEYFCGASDLHIHFAWQDGRAIGGTTRDVIKGEYCAVLRKFVRRNGRVDDLASFATNSRGDTGATHASTDENKLTVLVRVFEAADDSDWVSAGVLPL